MKFEDIKYAIRPLFIFGSGFFAGWAILRLYVASSGYILKWSTGLFLIDVAFALVLLLYGITKKGE